MGYNNCKCGKRKANHAVMCLECRTNSRFTGNVHITECQIAWVAGLLEGEGSWCVKKKRPSNKWISCTMTDYDVLEKLQQYTGIGIIYKGEAPKVEHHKQCYRWMACGMRNREWLSHLVYSYMGKRRQKQIDKLLSACNV